MHNPMPHTHPQPYEPVQWPAGNRTLLTPRSKRLDVDVVALLEQRQTRREFKSELTDVQLGEFLWLACRSRSSRPGGFSTPQESRPHPSAGGMHPIHVLVARPDQPWLRYDPVDHTLVEFPQTQSLAAAARSAAQHLVPIDRGTLLGLLAEPGKTAAKYANPHSLVWRDAGVVLGYMSLVAEALGLSYCPLGILGDPFLNSLLPNDSRLNAAGMAILGNC